MATRARQEQTALELRRLSDEVAHWLERRSREDQRGQYRTQLAALESLLKGGVAALDTSLSQLDLGLPAPDVYEETRLFDLRILWLRRVWQFFRDKFDQRDDPEMGPLLRAADEVVWSCHRQVEVRAEQQLRNQRLGPAPLPYLDAQYSPEAFPTELVPHNLKYDVDVGFLRDHLNELPIPVVRLPPVCVRAPWWLVFAGHEVGHHIQFSLLEGKELVNRFRDAVGAAVTAHGGREEDAERWRRWSPEVFADVFSVLVMGQWAVWAMVDLELKKPDAMARRRPLYPAPAVRLRLLAETASRLDLDGQGALRGLVTDAPQEDGGIARDIRMIAPVVTTALDALPAANVKLSELVAFRPEEWGAGGLVDRWAKDLRGGEQRPPAKNIRSARLVAAASVAAWAAVMEEEDRTKRASQRAALAERTLNVIVANAEEGTRAAVKAAPADLGVDLARVLLEAPREVLEG